MLVSEWVQDYNKLNNSFKDTLVFRMGTVAGFFSEYNHMIFAVAYCLKHRIKFVLSTRDNNFSYAKGWQDYFLPFCEEATNKLHAKFNHRGVPAITKTQDYSAAVFRHLIGVKYLTYQLFGRIRAQDFSERIVIPELNIDGNLIECCHEIIKQTWLYQPNVKPIIADNIRQLDLPEEYVGIHIRGGDKVIEHELFKVSDYIKAVQTLTECKNIYVATDEFDYVKALQTNFPDYTFFTRCRPEASGFVQDAFNVQSKEYKRTALLDLFTDVDVLNAGTFFVGAYTSNIGMYLGMRRGVDKCYCLDNNDWRIWAVN